MKKFAPVLIPTLNRFDHFKNCIESLSNCTHADETDLYISLDYPSKEEHWNGYLNIKNFIDEIKGFKTLNVIKREINFGAVKNYDESISYLFNIYDKIIFSEDDNVFSINFLDYMNKCLNRFFDNDKISAVCGYNFLIKIPESITSNYYYYRGFSAWGFGTWKHKFNNNKYTVNDMLEFIINKNNLKELNSISERHFFNLAKAILKNEERYGDFTMFLKNISENRFCIFPTLSKVKNLGNDGSGVNCEAIDEEKFRDQAIDKSKTFEFGNEMEIKTNKEINLVLKRYFRLSRKQKIFFPAVYILIKLYIIKFFLTK